MANLRKVFKTFSFAYAGAETVYVHVNSISQYRDSHDFNYNGRHLCKRVG